MKIQAYFLSAALIAIGISVTVTSCSEDEAITTPKQQHATAPAADRAPGTFYKDGGGTVERPIIQGTVYDSLNNPLSDARVKLVNEREPYNEVIDTTDVNGLYLLQVDSSAYSMLVSASGYPVKSIAAFLLEEDTTLNVTMD